MGWHKHPSAEQWVLHLFMPQVSGLGVVGVRKMLGEIAGTNGLLKH